MSLEKSDLPPAYDSPMIRHDSVHEGEDRDLQKLGYTAELGRNRSLWTLLFQTLAIAAIPYGEGGPLMSAIIGGGQLSIFLGWIVILVLDECVALSLAELASSFPTSAGPYYWVYQLAPRHKILASYTVGWIWLAANWTTSLSVNFGFASLLAASVSIYHPDFTLTAWQLLLIFYAATLLTFTICAFLNHLLPQIDTICAAWTLASIVAICIALSVSADVGRHNAAYALGHYDTSFSGWGGFTFFIGLLPAAYTFCALGMISSMAEEVSAPATQLPRALSLCVPIGGIAGLFFILPICFTLPDLEDIINNASYAQALPYIFHKVMGTPGGGLGLTFLVLMVTIFCSISITVAASRCTWAMARDNAIPFSGFFARVHPTLRVPVNALLLTSLVGMLLGLINLGSTSAFTAFVSVGLIGLAVSYALPIALSLFTGRKAVEKAVWNCGHLLGSLVNVVAISWIVFEMVLFSMPTVLPVTLASMNYASVVFVGFIGLSLVWYVVGARRVYKGPPESEGLVRTK